MLWRNTVTMLSLIIIFCIVAGYLCILFMEILLQSTNEQPKWFRLDEQLFFLHSFQKWTKWKAKETKI